MTDISALAREEVRRHLQRPNRLPLDEFGESLFKAGYLAALERAATVAEKHRSNEQGRNTYSLGHLHGEDRAAQAIADAIRAAGESA